MKNERPYKMAAKTAVPEMIDKFEDEAEEALLYNPIRLSYTIIPDSLPSGSSIAKNYNIKQFI